MHPNENVQGILRMRNIQISNTPGAGVRITSHSAAATMWTAHFQNLTLNNVGTTWPVPQIQPSAKDPQPCTLNAAPIVVGWFGHDEHLPWNKVYWKNGSVRTVPVAPVGGLVVENAHVIDSRNRPFISCGSPTFPNGTKYIDLMPQLVQNITFQGRITNVAKFADPRLVCAGDLGPMNGSTGSQFGYDARRIALAVQCHLARKSITAI